MNNNNGSTQSSTTSNSSSTISNNSNNNNSNNKRALQMSGSCISSTLNPGQQLTKGSYLCHTSSTTSIQYEFGINTQNQIVLYALLPTDTTSVTNTNNGGGGGVEHELLWTATPPPTSLSTSGVQYMRMAANTGSLAGYTPSRQKIYDSHLNSGVYSDFAKDSNGGGMDATFIQENPMVVKDRVPQSSLVMNDEGVFIVDDDGDVTFQILVPPNLLVATNNNSNQDDSTAAAAAGGAVNGEGTVQGFTWDDSTTNDAIYGAGDTSVTNVDVTLLECTSDKVLDRVTSGNDGTFRFENVFDGRYKVYVLAQPPLEFVTKNVNEGLGINAIGQDSDVNSDGFSDCFTIGTGTGGTLNQLIYVGMMEAKNNPITVSGKVFYDSNGDGLINDSSSTGSSSGSSLVGNIIVDLYDCIDPTKWIAVTRTDASGNYEFENPATTTSDLTSLLEVDGITQFRAVFSGLPNGYTFSPKSVDSDVTSVNGQTSCWDIEKDGGRTSIVWNAGIKPPQTERPTNRPTPQPTSEITLTPTKAAALVTVGGYAFLDMNDDGVRSPNFDEEIAIADINVRLFSGCDPSNNNDDGTFFSAARTDAQGLYKFVNVPPGSYLMKATAPTGYVFSSSWTDTNVDADSTINPETGETKCFVLNDGKTDLSWGMGLRDTSPVVISGMVFDDANNNGFFDTGETAMMDVSVALFDCDGNIKKMDNTDVNGMYGFSDLMAGPYLLKFSAPQGYQLSSTWSGLIDNEGKLVAPNADSNANPETASSVCKLYKAGEEVYSLDAGMTAVGTAPTTTTAASQPTSKPTKDPKGDGTLCSGAKCPVEGMCRNKAGLCGTGLGFCNFNSVWTKDCVEEDDDNEADDAPIAPDDVGALAPTTSFRPTTYPTISPAPTISAKPTSTFGGGATSFCHVDGAVGDVTDPNSEVSAIKFIYTIESESFSPSSTETLIDLFEKELNRRVACDFADNPCLLCDSPSKETRTGRSTRNSTMIGLSPLPNDEITLYPCQIPSSKCKVMNGEMTAYYPQGTSASVLESDQKQLLAAIEYVITNESWVGMQVSYQKTSLPSSNQGEKSGDPSKGGDGGLSGGAVAGIVVAMLAIVAVVFIGVIRIRRIRDEEDEALFRQMQEKSIPYGHAADLNGEDDDSDDDSDDSSYSSDDDSSEYRSKSAISGETFPTNIAHAMPQDIEDSSSSESGSSESEEEIEDGLDEGVDAAQLNQPGIEQMKYSAGSDDVPTYEDFDRMDSEEMAAAAGYDDHHRDQTYPYQTRPNRYVGDEEVAPDDATATESVNSAQSADPPGQSYRDLPEEWEPALPPPMEYSHAGSAFGAYESGSESDGERSNRSYRSNHSGSQRSNRSYHSRHSLRSHGSRQSRNSHRSQGGGSHYSRHSNPDQEETSGNGSYHQSAHNDSYHSEHSYHSNHSGSGSDRSFSEDYGQSDDQFTSRQQQGEPNHFNRPPQPQYYDQHSQYMGEQDAQAYIAAAAASRYQTGAVSNNNSSRYGSQEAAYHGGGDSYDDASYHSFNSSPQSQKFQPEVLDDHIDDASAYTSATRKATNVSPDKMSPPRGGQDDQSYEEDDDEESISEIFKSLSAIQTKLASKGKPGGPRPHNKGVPSRAPEPQSQQQGWQDGIVEDVSVDGSQISSVAANQHRNRRPQQGQWMEPVDEQED
ncbi:hypothetical protein ACHAWC_005642 [Mediolabrus comicus]